MTDFADWDPEDAYDVDDPVPARLDVLDRVVESLQASSDRREDRRADALRVVANFDREDIDRRARRRLQDIRDALEDL